VALGVVGDVVLEGVDDVDIERIVVDQAKDKLQTNLVELVSLEDVFNLLDPLADCVCLLLCLQTKHVSFFFLLPQSARRTCKSSSSAS